VVLAVLRGVLNPYFRAADPRRDFAVIGGPGVKVEYLVYGFNFDGPPSAVSPLPGAPGGAGGLTPLSAELLVPTFIQGSVTSAYAAANTESIHGLPVIARTRARREPAAGFER
jgi:hypothetical protein